MNWIEEITHLAKGMTEKELRESLSTEAYIEENAFQLLHEISCYVNKPGFSKN